MEKVPIKYYPKWLKWRFRGTTIYPIGIFIKDASLLNDETFINHEQIHWQQQKEMLCLPFYLWYFLEWLVNLVLYGRKAYKNISFEQEAYFFEDVKEYIKSRNKYSWIEFIKWKPVK